MKDIPGFPGYQATEEGRIFSLKRNRFLAGNKLNRGYRTVSLCLHGKQYTCSVHRLVAMAFIPNPQNLPQVNHIDTDKTNNSVTNLEWVNSQENITHAIKMGVWSHGNGDHFRKLTPEQVEFIRQSDDSSNTLGKLLGVNGSTVRRVRGGVTHKTVSAS